MNIPEDLEISLGLSESLRAEAAEMFYEAFGQKIRPQFGSKESAIAIFRKAIDPELTMVALCQDRFVGLAGLRYDDRSFLQFNLSIFTEELGTIKGTLSFFLYTSFKHRVRQGELFLDALVVQDSARGQGIGTFLLQEIFEFARQNQFDRIRLDVAAANSSARRLYERMGFTCFKTRSYLYLQRIVGATAIDMMQKQMN
ncbi:GNAT family N-acetyltransferase [Tumidithrix helvetica PCC 7403]|uniref:GNAT family N-acetyltransferase n=1 Tax=Tumidithrix helvetica TaxID=3457545 RepID=UPI003C9B6525